MVGEIKELILIRHKRDGQEFHIRLLWRAVRFAIITASTGGHDIGPDVTAALGSRNHVIA